MPLGYEHAHQKVYKVPSIPSICAHDIPSPYPSTSPNHGQTSKFLLKFFSWSDLLLFHATWTIQKCAD